MYDAVNGVCTIQPTEPHTVFGVPCAYLREY